MNEENMMKMLITENNCQNPGFAFIDLTELNEVETVTVLGTGIPVSLNKYGIKMVKGIGRKVGKVVEDVADHVGYRGSNVFQLLYQKKPSLLERNGALWSLSLGNIIQEVMKEYKDKKGIAEERVRLQSGSKKVNITSDLLSPDNTIHNLAIVSRVNDLLFFELVTKGRIAECKKTSSTTYDLTVNKQGYMYLNSLFNNQNRFVRIVGEVSDADFEDAVDKTAEEVAEAEAA